jgi:hypothetical protein
MEAQDVLEWSVDSFQTKLENYLGNERRKMAKAALRQIAKATVEKEACTPKGRGKGGGKERTQKVINSLEMTIGAQVNYVTYI